MIELGDDMTKVRKKKLKLKKKNFAIFITCIIFIIYSIIYGTSVITKTLKESKKQNTKTTEKKQTTEEKKLEKLNNIDKKIDYFNYAYIDRYLEYQKENKELPTTQVITEVNIGLDNPYYTNTKPAKDLNKSYILVNKYNYLKEDYEPKNLETIKLQYARSGMKLVNYAKDAFEKMAKDAENENLKIIAMSTYRDYSYQKNLYNRYAENDGKDTADTYSGRAGFSEHQTGLAVDIYNGTEDYTNFEKTKEFQWMKKNAHKYGFILRFPKDKTKQTGYEYESWHYRYVGIKVATYIKEKNLSYEEYYVQNIENKKNGSN